MKNILFTGLIILTTALFAGAQISSQNLRGVIVDKQSQSPIPGVTVIILDSTKNVGTTTDINGNFLIKDIPIGRVSIKAILMGYSPVILRNPILDSGKF